MPLASLNIEFEGIGHVQVLDGEVPGDSLLHQLGCLDDLPKASVGPTHLKLDPTNTELKAWLERPRGHQAAIIAKGTDPAKEMITLNVVRHENPSLRKQGWVTVLGETVGILRMVADESVPHIVVSILKDYYEDEQKEVNGKQRTALSPTAMAAQNLVKSLRALERRLPDGVSNANEKLLERLATTWAAWADFVGVPETDLGEARPVIADKLARLADLRADTDPHFSLSSAHAQLNALHSIHYALVRVHGKATAAKTGALPPPDYARMSKHITRELMAFYSLVRETTTNNDVLGALIEARLRKMIGQWLGHLQLATGTLAGLAVDYQIDGIVWDPTIRPALIEEGEIVVVDPLAVNGLIEIKSSCNIEEFSRRLFNIAAHIGGYFDRVAEGHRHPPVFGFVLWDEDDYETIRLRTGRWITCLSRRRRPEEFAPDPRAIADLLEFVYTQIHRRQ